MKKLIIIETQDLNENNQCTLKQFQYARDLLFKAKRDIDLTTLQKFGIERLTKKSASKLIDTLLKNEDFELRQLKG